MIGQYMWLKAALYSGHTNFQDPQVESNRNTL